MGTTGKILVKIKVTLAMFRNMVNSKYWKPVKKQGMTKNKILKLGDKATDMRVNDSLSDNAYNDELMDKAYVLRNSIAM